MRRLVYRTLISSGLLFFSVGLVMLLTDYSGVEAQSSLHNSALPSSTERIGNNSAGNTPAISLALAGAVLGLVGYQLRRTSKGCTASNSITLDFTRDGTNKKLNEVTLISLVATSLLIFGSNAC